MIVFDATSLMLLINPSASPPRDPKTKQPVVRATERYALLASQLEKARATIIVPTPSLAEVLVRAEDGGPDVLERFYASAYFKVADFDARAAVEHAAMTREAIRAGDKMSGSKAPWQKLKIDRQIVAIARVHQASAIYSDDEQLGKFAERMSLRVVRTWELPLPEEPTPDLLSFLNRETMNRAL